MSTHKRCWINKHLHLFWVVFAGQNRKMQLCGSLRAQFCCTVWSVCLACSKREQNSARLGTLHFCEDCCKKKQKKQQNENWLLSQLSEAVVLNTTSCIKTVVHSTYKDLQLFLSVHLRWSQTHSRVREWLLLRIGTHMHTSCALLLCVVHRGILFGPKWDTPAEECLQLLSPRNLSLGHSQSPSLC